MGTESKTKTPEPLLKIDTLAPERPTVTIDDVEYDFRLLQEFGAIEHREFTRDTGRYDDLWRKDKLSKVEEGALQRLLDRLFDQVLVDAAGCREALGDRLTGYIKREVVLTFTNAPLLMAAMAQTANEARESSTTES